MNTVTQSETLALSAVAAAAAVSSAAMTGDSVTVSEVAPYELHLIPLSRLRPSSRNVRQSGGTAIPELAASYEKHAVMRSTRSSAALQQGRPRSTSFALRRGHSASSHASSSGLRRHRGGLVGRVD